MSYESALEPKTNDPSEVDNKNNASNKIMRPEKVILKYTIYSPQYKRKSFTVLLPWPKKSPYDFFGIFPKNYSH